MWLQIVEQDRFKGVNGENIDNSGTFDSYLWPTATTPDKDRDVVGREYGTWYLDGGLQTSPWMTANNTSRFDRTPTSLTMWDSPSAVGLLTKD
jgi:hypothetical protein